MTEKEKVYRTQVAKKMIDLKKETISLRDDLTKTNDRVDRLEGEIEEQRRMMNQVKRTLWEYIQIALGHRKEVEDLSRRVTDTGEKFDKIQDTIDWITKLLIGTLITSIISAILIYLFSAH